jgi:hypothetical protein
MPNPHHGVLGQFHAFDLSSMNGYTRSLASNNIALQVKMACTPHLHIEVVRPGDNCFTLESNQMFVISEYACCTGFLHNLEL